MCFKTQKKNRPLKENRKHTPSRNWVQKTARGMLGCKVHRLPNIVKSPKRDTIITQSNLNKQTKALIIFESKG